MNFNNRIKIKNGEIKSFPTIFGDLNVELKNGSLTYTRQPDDDPAAKPVEKTFLIGKQEKTVTLSFLPVYPDRPLVFRITDNLIVPPGEKGFFSLQLHIGIGLTILETDTLIEEILPENRKNTYWGPPTGGILAYQYKCPAARSAAELARNTGPLIAVVPVNFVNQREVAQEVSRCLIPLRELNIYKTEQNELVFETVQLIQRGENDQVPNPLKRPPKEFGSRLKKLTQAPNKPRSLLEKVGAFSGWQQITGMFADR
ncbi:MAG: DUF432 domain-containing protein [bacterium]